MIRRMAMLGMPLALTLAATPASANDGKLTTQLPAGFTIGHQDANRDMMLIEMIPIGETVFAWSRMVSVMRFEGLSGRVSPEQLEQEMVKSLQQSCPGGTTSAVTVLKVDGRNAARMRADCPTSAYGNGGQETFFALAIAGPQDLHMVQVAFHRIPTPEDEAWAEQIMAETRWCSTSGGKPACKD